MTVDDNQAVQGLVELRRCAFLGIRGIVRRFRHLLDRVAWQDPRVVSSVHPQLPSLMKHERKERRITRFTNQSKTFRLFLFSLLQFYKNSSRNIIGMCSSSRICRIVVTIKKIPKNASKFVFLAIVTKAYQKYLLARGFLSERGITL